MIIFGPVPSRRLGKSLGINNIPSSKICSYSCIYCQIGITEQYSSSLKPYYTPLQIYEDVEEQLKKTSENNKPDSLTFVSNGEPTLDIRLNEWIIKLKELSIPVAAITNTSMLHISQVRDNLQLADWISVKIDTDNEYI